MNNAQQNRKADVLFFRSMEIPITRIDGQYFLPIKPICEALQIDYLAHFKNLKDDSILAQLLSNQTMVAADNRLRNMVCLPEKYIYGWLFGVRSKSIELETYKKECYDVLYNHFHGTLTRRNELLLEKAELLEAIDRSRSELITDERYIAINESQKQIKRLNASLKAHDISVMTGQTALFEQNS